MIQSCEAAVIGGGFFGCAVAVHLRAFCDRVVLLEKQADLLQRASYHNQARVHHGYHYPRSTLTALRSRVNLPRFSADFADCIDRGFAKYYAVPSKFSKVTARQFYEFCKRIGAPIEVARGPIRRFFNADLIEEVFAVEEYAFNAAKLRERMRQKLADAGVEVCLGTVVTRAERGRQGDVCLTCESPVGAETLQAGQAFVCTYSQLNQVLRASGLPVVPLKHELTELALVEVPEPLRDVGVTVMCGPFFSFMPFPPRGVHTLSHVRYTPHEAWQDGPVDGRDAHAYFERAPKRSSYPEMIRDVRRYVPALGEARYVDSLWEVKTVLPGSEADDSRPILFRRHHGLPGLHCILGAKVDNVYDACAEVETLFPRRKVA